MINLLKADLFRVLRTKIVYISLIVAFVLPLFIAVVNGLSEMAVRSLDPDMPSVSGVGDTLLSSSFSPLMSFSYIFVVFPIIVIMMDFGNGTLRNKVIHGYTRHQIYASHFIITLLHIAVITLIFATTNIVSALVLGISEVPSSLIPVFILYHLVGYLSVVLVASIGCSLALALGNAGAIVLSIFATLIINYLGTIIGLILELNKVSGYENILCFLPSFYTESLSNFMLLRTEVKIEPMKVLGAILSVLVVSGGFYALGTMVFNKRDFK